MFQSHLRPIHPIHRSPSTSRMASGEVSIASAPHPPYPPHMGIEQYSPVWVSIASAPHPPYPQAVLRPTRTPRAVSIASAPHPPYPLVPDHALRVSNPRFNRICAPSTLSTCSLITHCACLIPVSIASAPHPPYPRKLHKSILLCI